MSELFLFAERFLCGHLKLLPSIKEVLKGRTWKVELGSVADAIESGGESEEISCLRVACSSGELCPPNPRLRLPSRLLDVTCD